jgi:membrane protein DedA with SNARE-associated domain
MIELTDFIQQYGYAAVLVGTFFEGESVALLGGFLAHGELLDLTVVIVVTFIGSFCGDQTAYWLGRRYGSRWKPRSVVLQRRLARTDQLLHRYQIPVLLGFRFVYGIRNATPFVAGSISTIPLWRFILLNAIGAAIWSTSVPLAGYYFGHTAQSLLGTREIYEDRALLVLVVGGLVIWLARYLLARRQAARSSATDVENPRRTQ